MKKIRVLLVCAAMAVSIAGCTKENERKKEDTAYTPVSNLNTDETVTLTIAIPYETNKALNSVSNAFISKYPNVNIDLEYVEDYDKNAVQLLKDNAVDIILQKDIAYTEYTVKNEETNEESPTGMTTDDYFYNFAEEEEIDFSDTTDDITGNYRHIRTDDAGREITYQYSYPLGGETRGVFVNKTLLDAYDLSVPENYTQLLACCETLKQAGLIPIQGGGDTAAFSLGLAPAANAVVHDKKALADLATAEPGISQEFSSTLEKFYTIAENRYFDYKEVEKNGYFTSTNELGQAESFLGLQMNTETFEVTKPDNHYGYAAFMPYISSTETVIQSLIDEYDLETEVVFICSPLNDEGTNSVAYITPYYGVCANKNSNNLVWIREFVNFLFQEETNKIYADEASIIPNTADAMQMTAEKYGIDPKKDITLCGQIRFSDTYNAYSPISIELKNVLKCNAEKYMVNLNRDKNGEIQYELDEEGHEFLYLGNEETIVRKEYVGEENPEGSGYALCTLEYFLDDLENQFANYRVNDGT